MIREALDLMMPRECLVCGRKLGVREQHLCIWCASDLPLTWYWEQPHNPMADAFNAVLERFRGQEEAMPYAYAAALLFYHHENPYKAIPKALKYDYNIPAGRFFAARLGRYLAGTAHFSTVDTVVPVPLHWMRKWRRGYNQSAVIADELARELGACAREDVLIRAGRTRSQTHLDAPSRLKNVEGAFLLRHGIPARHVLLVDDTFTTGATLAACYLTLRRALGPAVRISVATLAVVRD